MSEHYGWQDDGSFRLLDEPRGTLAGWSEAANMLFAAGCEAQSMALLASFGSPLMELLPTEEGGAVVSIWGKRGVTTALTAAATVWSDPARLANMDFAEYGGLPWVTSSLSRLDPTLAGETIGFLLGHADPMLTISGGGVSLVETFAASEMAGGLEFRVTVPKGLIVGSDKDRLSRQLVLNRGTAAAAYVAYISRAQVLTWAETHLAARVAQMRDETGLGEEWRFAMRAIAACWVGGQLAVEAGIISCDPDRIARWAIENTFPKERP